MLMCVNDISLKIDEMDHIDTPDMNESKKEVKTSVKEDSNKCLDEN